MATSCSNKRFASWQIAAPVLLGIGLTLMASWAFAGECIESRVFYVQRLEQLARQTPPDMDFLILPCLGCYPEDHMRWAGPMAARRFAECRNSNFRNRIAAACSVYLNSTRGGIYEFYAEKAAILLAFYGFGKVEEHDVFEILTSNWRVSEYPPMEKLMALAALQDPRTASSLSEIYDSLQANEEAQYEEHVVGILNCLYHIPGDEAVRLAERIYKETADMRLRERAQRVIAR